MKGCIKIEFNWTDTISDEFHISYDVNFEFYSMIFNLATLYYFIGFTLDYQKNFKEAKINFEISAGIFQYLKDMITLIPLTIKTKDFDETHIILVS